MSDVTLVGNLTKDPELRYAPSGSAWGRVSLAVNRRFERGGEQVEETDFFDLKFFGDLAENVAESLTKGNRVVVSGRLSLRPWESEGRNGTAVEVACYAIGPDLRFATASVVRNERVVPVMDDGGEYADPEPEPAKRRRSPLRAAG